MNTQEAAALLGIAAAFDNRKPDADAAQAWAIALSDIRFEDARDAIVAHYRMSSEWLMPVKVIAEVRRIRDKRLADYGAPTPPPDLDPDDVLAFQRWLRDERKAIGDGAKTPADEVQAVDAPKDWRELGPGVRHVDEA